jgi:hypothetical protein
VVSRPEPFIFVALATKQLAHPPLILGHQLKVKENSMYSH